MIVDPSTQPAVLRESNDPPVSELETDISCEALGLPRLNYNLWDHKTKLFIVTTLLVLECSLLPIALFYGLWYGTTLRHGILFAIITSFFGIITGLEFVLRCWRLVQPDDTYRPLGGKRWRFDATHWTLSAGYTVMTGILVGASIPWEPLVRPLALPVPLFLVQMALMLLWTGWAHARRVPAPCRISSLAKGEVVRPFVFTIVEDVVAVDGGAGRSYRKRLFARYDASPRFRALLIGLNWFWGVGALVDGVGTLVVLWTVDQNIAYGVGWGSPFVFVCIWTGITLHWVRKALRVEKKLWMSDSAT